MPNSTPHAPAVLAQATTTGYTSDAPKHHAVTLAPDERPPASYGTLELIGFLAIAAAAGAVYVGARRTRQDRPGSASVARDKPKPRRASKS
ncbi:hypothetical protein [Methylibium sp.]|uniref:hypothetical protein n=1 Tax=Methylibium sp. TaxID=2067992 RepID=UPI003D0B5BA5